jgi:hypothetical protein
VFRLKPRFAAVKVIVIAFQNKVQASIEAQTITGKPSAKHKAFIEKTLE